MGPVCRHMWRPTPVPDSYFTERESCRLGVCHQNAPCCKAQAQRARSRWPYPLTSCHKVTDVGCKLGHQGEGPQLYECICTQEGIGAGWRESVQPLIGFLSGRRRRFQSAVNDQGPRSTEFWGRKLGFLASSSHVTSQFIVESLLDTYLNVEYV